MERGGKGDTGGEIQHRGIEAHGFEFDGERPKGASRQRCECQSDRIAW